MRNLYFYYCFLFFTFFCASTSKAQLTIDTKGLLHIATASGGTLGSYDNTNAGVALFVDGDITIKNTGVDKGTYTNVAAETQLTGNITNNGTFTTTGDEVFVSAPNLTIITDINQRITGTFTGTSNFYNFITHKPATKYVELAANVDAANSIKFNNSGRIRTDIAGHTNDGSAYTYEIYLKNGTTTSLVGASTGNGATEKYIEGKLRRKSTATGIFTFPIGVDPASLDGMEAFDLNFTANPNMDFVGYIKPASVNLGTRNILCDVGKDPGPGNDPFSNCNGAPDGIFDWYYLENTMDLSHEWVATPSGATTGYSYGITLHPGNSLDFNNASNYYTIPNGCGTPYKTQRIRVIAKDGIVGGNTQVGPGYWAPWKHLGPSYIWCQFDNSDLDLTLNSQTSFSTYRIHGTQLNAQTALPVELISLKAEPVNNEYINVSWATASELNNQGFEVLRSSDATNYISIGFVNGNGTTNQEHQYSIDDHDVQADVLYYYKLKQLDFNGTYKYTYVVSAKLNSTKDFTISDIYPNPITTEGYVNIFTPIATKLTYSIYNPIGQEIGTKIIQLDKGSNKVILTDNNLANGVYLIRFNYNDNIITKKLIKQ